MTPKELATEVIIACRTTAAHKFRARLRFTQFDVSLIKERSVLMKLKSLFDEENMHTQNSVLGYRIDLYFYDHKLAIEIDENGHSDRAFNEIFMYIKQPSNQLLEKQ